MDSVPFLLIRNPRARLLPHERAVASQADADALSASLTAVLQGDVASLPDALPWGVPGLQLTRVPQLRLPEDLGTLYLNAPRYRRGQYLRAALQLLEAWWRVGLYRTQQVTFPGTAVPTMRMTAGQDLSVQRAAWRTRRGTARASSRPGEVLTASETGFSGTGHPGLLWEVWGGTAAPELLRVISAESLYAAATYAPLSCFRCYDPEVLWRREALLSGREKPAAYLKS